MAKKRKSYRKNNGKDKHHIWYQARHYSKGSLASLRQYPYSKIMIPRETLHRTIHEFVGDIPAPSQLTAQRVLNELRRLYRVGEIGDDDNFEERLSVIISLLDFTDQPTVDALKRQLAIVREFYKPP